MKRMKFLFGQRRMQVLLTLAVLLLAASVVIGSGANFTAQSANPDNIFTAGNLSHLNSKNNAAILTANKMKPKDMVSGFVVITNDGDIPGDFTLTSTVPALTDIPGFVGGPLFSGLLTVKIYETKVLPVTGAKTQIYGGANGAVINVSPNYALGTFAVDEQRRYDFEVTFPNGTPAHDNDYKKATTSITYTWTSITP
jgi:spore coat-associated protein N